MVVVALALRHAVNAVWIVVFLLTAYLILWSYRSHPDYVRAYARSHWNGLWRFQAQGFAGAISIGLPNRRCSLVGPGL
jgi:hypothetical protein